MVNLTAQKTIDIAHIIAIATIKEKQNRPDLVWLLKNQGNWGLTRGETENLEKYLEYLNLMKKGSLTSLGENALKTNDVMIPESGLYDFFLVKDRVIGNIIIAYQRRWAGRFIEGNTEVFSDFELYDEQIFSTWDKDAKELYIRFEHQSDSPPVILREQDIPATMTLTHEEDHGTAIRVKSQDGQYQFEGTITTFLLDDNLSSLLSDWNLHEQALKMPYSDVANNLEIFNTFTTSETLHTDRLLYQWGVDSASYEVSIHDIPVLPKGRSDAKQWLYALVMDRFEKEQCYATAKYLESLEKTILKSTIINKEFRDLFISAPDLFKRLKKDEFRPNLHDLVQVAEDLVPAVLYPSSGGEGYS